MGGVSFLTQANALLRKDLTSQKRNMTTNLRLILFPIFILLLLRGIQFSIDKQANNKCEKNGEGQCKPRCGSGSLLSQNPECAIPNPPEWLPLVDFRFPNGNLPNDSCREARSCPVSVLVTGANKSVGEILSRNMFPSSFILPPNDTSFDMIADNVLGTQVLPDLPNYRDPGFVKASTIYSIQSQCVPRSAFSGHLPKQIAELANAFGVKVGCLQGLPLWRNSSSEVNEELYKGYRRGNLDGNINEILAGYDFLNTNGEVFNMSIWFNRTQEIMDDMGPRLRIPRLVNLISNAFLQYLQGPGTKMRFLFTKEMPKAEFPPEILDITSAFGVLFFVWIILQLFPVMLTSLVYEKQHKLRLMMKMHGLGDRAYWMSSYANFLIICSLYMVFFVVTGAVVGLNFFRLNDYRVQAVFYFLFINLLIASAFLAANVFSNTATATVVTYLGIFATGLVGFFILPQLIESSEVPRIWLIVLELYPGFSLFRGLYEFGEAIKYGDGMQWSHLHNRKNEMRELLILISVEWLVLLVIAFCIDQFASSSGGGKLSSFLLRNFCKKDQSSIRTPSQESNVSVDMEKPDVTQERLKVSQSLLERNSNHAIVCDDLKKVYPGMDGNPDKFAVRGLSLAIPKGECFGMLGPNGAGKTSFISMMIGLSKPTAGTAYVEGLDIKTDMPSVHACMGVCPQFDLLWETLTGREHLLFYARLKNLTGSALTEAVEESLKGVNLYNGGLADRPAGNYSGGMKRRLSVAISLVGDPKVVYLDEPSTGLDPVSRKYLWNVVKRAKNDRAIILTTHSMEEAEALCDRLGIFSDGSLQCVGYPKELKSRYGGSYVFTLTTSSKDEGDVENLVRSLFPNAIKVYHLSGTQKFELPKSEVKIAHVFRAVEKAKNKFQVTAWGVSDTTLEDVFIKVARGTTASRFSSLS